MKKLQTSVFAALFSALSIGGASGETIILDLNLGGKNTNSAQQERDPRLPEDICETLGVLDQFIEAHSGFIADGSCPRILIEEFAPITSPDAETDQIAAYYLESDLIQISPELDLTTHEGLGYLLHERFHYYQHKQEEPLTLACDNYLELPAYMLQARYMRENGDEKNANMLVAIGVFASMCPQNSYDY